jgi:hypothetical protein
LSSKRRVWFLPIPICDGLAAAKNGERVRIAFTLDSCDYQALCRLPSTSGIDIRDIRDRMIETVERCFGLVPRGGHRLGVEASYAAGRSPE